MAVPIKEYIDIRTVSLRTIPGRHFFGLVFTDAELASGKTSEDYTSGKPIAVSSSAEVDDLFGSTSKIAKFAAKYFGYSVAASRLYLAKYGLEGDTPSAALTRVLDSDANFGAITYLDIADASASGLSEVKAKMSEFGLVLVFPTTAGSYAVDTAALGETEGVQVILDVPESDVNYGAWMPLAWYASANYAAARASGTIEFKQFGGATATVTDSTTKTAMDNVRVNYIVNVKTHGNTINFYQTGRNLDGEDLGVYRDKIWIKGEAETQWMTMLTSATIPANADGLLKVYSMLVGVAEAAIDNGCILVDKPLTAAQRAAINAKAGVSSAADAVERTGYYIATTLVEDGGRYKVVYVLIYAKGDHISKLEGEHYLV